MLEHIHNVFLCVVDVFFCNSNYSRRRTKVEAYEAKGATFEGRQNSTKHIWIGTIYELSQVFEIRIEDI